jgi:TPR repeat protein
MIWFRKGAERNDLVAENNIGWLYENGWGVAKDYSEAMNWFRKSATQGYALAQTNIGVLYEHGWGV